MTHRAACCPDDLLTDGPFAAALPRLDPMMPTATTLEILGWLYPVLYREKKKTR